MVRKLSESRKRAIKKYNSNNRARMHHLQAHAPSGSGIGNRMLTSAEEQQLILGEKTKRPTNLLNRRAFDERSD